MFAKQLTIFIENRTGRLCEVLNVLKKNDVNILSMSLADTTEFGLLRLIVDKPEAGKERLAEGGFSSLLSDISIIKIPHSVGSLQELLEVIDKSGVNIEYMYALVTSEAGKAYTVMRTDDNEITESILRKNGIEILDESHI